MATTSRSCVSLFDKELNDLLRGIRILGKDFGHGSGNDDQIKPAKDVQNHRKSNVLFRLILFGGDKELSINIYRIISRNSGW